MEKQENAVVFAPRREYVNVNIEVQKSNERGGFEMKFNKPRFALRKSKYVDRGGWIAFVSGVSREVSRPFEQAQPPVRVWSLVCFGNGRKQALAVAVQYL